MPQAIINFSNKISTIHAIEAVERFVTLNYKMRRTQGYMTERILTLHSCDLKLKVVESKHDNEKNSPASVVFSVEKERIEIQENE